MKKLLFVLLALSVVAWLGCGDTMTDQMGTDSANGADVDITEILTQAAQGYYQIPNALIPLTEDTNILALYGDTEFEGYVQEKGDNVLVQVTPGVQDELDDDVWFPIFGGAIAGQLSEADVVKVWDATAGAFVTKYDFGGGIVVTDPTRFAAQSVLTWFAIDNPNFNQYTSDAQTATQYSTRTFAYTYTANVTFTEAGQQVGLIMAFADPAGNMNGAVAVAVTASATASVANCAILIPDPIIMTGSDVLAIAATGGTYTTVAAYQAAGLGAGFIQILTINATPVPLFVTPSSSAVNTAVGNHVVQMVVSGGTATAGATIKAFVDSVEVASFTTFNTAIYDGTTPGFTSAELWSSSWNKDLSASTEKGAFMLLLKPGANRTLSPSVSLLASSPTQ